MKKPPTSLLKGGKQPHRTAQQPTLAAFLPWGSSAGAGRAALAGRKSSKKPILSLPSKKKLGPNTCLAAAAGISKSKKYQH